MDNGLKTERYFRLEETQIGLGSVRYLILLNSIYTLMLFAEQTHCKFKHNLLASS